MKKPVIYAWIGEDELGSGVTGIKQGLVRAGYIPLAAMDFDLAKLTTDDLTFTLENQALIYGKRIYLCRFELVAVVQKTEAGTPNKDLEP